LQERPLYLPVGWTSSHETVRKRLWKR